MPAAMPPSRYLKTRASEEILAAVEAYCREHGVEKSELLRRAVCDKIGKPELADQMPPEGRPQTKGEKLPPAKPSKKRRR